MQGVKFRRQTPVGPYRADFSCPAAKLIVEIDGSQHTEAQGYDGERTRFLEAQGYRVLRVWNNDVLGKMDLVLPAIVAALATPHPGASGLGVRSKVQR